MTWSDDDLDRTGTATEVEITSTRPDGNGWFRRAQASGTGRIRAGGIECAVTFSRPEGAVQKQIDAAYHARYDRHGPKIIGSVIGSQVNDVTLRLEPAP